MATPSSGTNPVLRQLGLGPQDRAVILHVDDVGMCQAAMQAYTDVVDFGLTTSGSAMAPAPWFPAFVRWRRDHPSADAGAHLTLTSEWEDFRWRPVSHPTDCSGLTDADGYLHRTVEALVQSASVPSVRAELEAQVAALKNTGTACTHLDAHMFAALEAPFLGEYLRLGLSRRVPVLIRPEIRLRDAASTRLLAQAEAEGMPRFDRVQVLNLKGPPATWLREACRVIDDLPPGLTCLLTHPARETEELKAIVPNWTSRVADYRMLTNSEWARHIRDAGIQLLDYAALGRVAFPASDRREPTVGSSSSPALSAAAAGRRLD